jgi:hypothetical protein
MINYLTLNLTHQEHKALLWLILGACVIYLLRKLYVYVTSEGV